MQWNKEQMQQKLSPAYEGSMLNPEQAEKRWPGCGAWYALIRTECVSGYEDTCLGKEALAQEKVRLLEAAEAIFAGNETPEEKAEKDKKIRRFLTPYFLRFLRHKTSVQRVPVASLYAFLYAFSLFSPLHFYIVN